MSSQYDPRRGVPSASIMESLEQCPGSWNASQAVTAPPEESDDAASGTRIHTALETEDWSTLTLAEQETAERCQSQTDELALDWANEGIDCQEFRERRLGLTRIGGVVEVTEGWPCPPLLVSGQADRIWIDGTRGMVLDYKTGRGEVEAAECNAQLRTLAVLAAKRWGLSSVRVAIVQPWAGKPSVADYDADVLASAEAWLRAVLARAQAATPEDLCAGDHCQYCPARATCPEATGAAIQVVQQLFPVRLPDPSDKEEQRKLFARAMHLPALEVRDMLRLESLSEWVFSALRAAAKQRLADGDSELAQHFRLTAGTEIRVIEDAQAAFQLASEYGVSTEQFMKCVKVGIGDLEEQIRRASGQKICADGTPHKTQMNMSARDAKAALSALEASGAMVKKKSQPSLEEIE